MLRLDAKERIKYEKSHTNLETIRKEPEGHNPRTFNAYTRDEYLDKVKQLEFFFWEGRLYDAHLVQLKSNE